MSDLRFTIGLFFLIVSGVLLLAHLLTSPRVFSDPPLNLLAGVFMGIFSVLMLGIAFWKSRD